MLTFCLRLRKPKKGHYANPIFRSWHFASDERILMTL